MDTAIDVSGVSKRFRLYHEKNSTLKATVMRRRRGTYEEFWALDDVSLEVPQGSTFALIGENGSGKSTLLKCMARILQPDRGEIAVDGRVSALLELGAGFHEELSGRENIYLNGSILGLSRREIDQRFDGIVEFAGGEVPRFIDNPVKTYSSGMFVRLGFAIAINVQPDILLIDEILAVGDEDFQRKCMEKFADFHRLGRTVVVVSHSLDVVRNLCDGAAWLEHGKIRALGPAGQVVDQYLRMVSDQREERRGDPVVVRGRNTGLVDEVSLLNRDGDPTTALRTGEAATVRVGMNCGTTGDQEILRVEIYDPDGTYVSVDSTRHRGVDLHDRSGRQIVEYHIPRVLMAPGTYDLSIAVVGREGRDEHDRVDHVLRFEVVPGEVRSHGGYLLMGGAFSAQPAEQEDAVVASEDTTR